MSVVELTSGDFTVHRLYVRAADRERYHPIGEPSPEESQHSPVVCPATPSVYFLSTVLERFGDGVGGWIRGVLRYDMTTSSIRTIVEYPIRKEHDVWVAGLHGANADGSALFCSVAFARRVKKGREIDYVLCALDPGTGALERIAPLRAVFA